MTFIKSIFVCCLVFSSSFLCAQSSTDFENFNLDSESFLNGDDGSGGFNGNNIFLPNSYNTQWESWSGWAISNTTDVTTTDYVNQYSAITGSGAENSETYAVAYAPGVNIINLEDDAAGTTVDGFFITNTTIAYLSMLNGDGFAKQFGGTSGDEPDFYLLTIRAFQNGEISTDSVDFYLADYRSEDNTQDYIVDEWTYIDLTSLGDADSLSFVLSSSDNGMFGMNTPAYFCMDNFTTTNVNATNTPSNSLFASVYPNPTSDFLSVKTNENETVNAVLYDMLGKAVLTTSFQQNSEALNIQQLPAGTYTLTLENGKARSTQLLVKQ